MSYRHGAIAAAALSLATLLPAGLASAADMPVKAVKAPADLPFFLVIDDRLTFSYIFKGTDPNTFTRNPNGTLNSTTAKQVYSFTHFDVWGYGTNFFTISMFKSDHNDPANGCNAPFTACAGATEIFGHRRPIRAFHGYAATQAFRWQIQNFRPALR